MRPGLGGSKSHQAVLPKLLPAPHEVGSGSPPPPVGRPSRLGLKVSACVVASVVSTVSRYCLPEIVVEPR